MPRNRLSTLALLLLAGCAPVQEREFDYQRTREGAPILVGSGAAFDIKTGEHWWQRFLDHPHRILVLHVKPDEWQFHSEQADSDIWSQLQSPLTNILPTVTPSIPLTPAP